MIDSANLYHCEPCTEEKYGKKSSKKHRTQALKRLLILDPPKNLIINLKRFQQTGGFSFSKNSNRISFPAILSLDELMVHKIPRSEVETIQIYQEASDDRPWASRYQYQLYGVVCHSGSMGGGHYVSYTCYDYQGQRVWLYISDSFVEKVDEKRVLSCEAYILFYRQISSDNSTCL